VAGVGDFVARHTVIGIDTPVFIYQLERASGYSRATRLLFDLVGRGGIRAFTSVVTITEVTTRPYLLRDAKAAEDYLATLLQMPNLRVIDIGVVIADRAAQLRGRYRLRTPDALQLAACLEAGATGFVTNDRRLRVVAELDVLVLAETDEVAGADS